jgi:uncharacterized protein (TIGR03435 family)
MLLNHLWQSTAFLGVAALIALALRRRPAEARYWVWTAASLKFLLPFSVLVSIGERFAWRAAPAAGAVSLFLEQAAEPFVPHVPPLTHPEPIPVAALLTAAWLVGCTFVLLRWSAAWLRVRAMIREAEPIDGEVGQAGRLVLLRSPSTIEPGVFGIFRPVLLLPTGIAAYLDDSQLEAVIAHELSHIRRRDNLFAAIHMLVEALFWFHPLVWWLGTRLVEERERACDEDVLRNSSPPESYAEGILKVCRLCMEAPPPCVAGITGAGLARRIERIMTPSSARPLGRVHKLLLATAAVSAIAAPLVTGALTVRPALAQPKASGKAAAFDAVSIKLAHPGALGTGVVVDPGRLRLINLTLKQCISEAFGLADFRISAPDGLPSERYDIVVTVPGHTSREFDPPLQAMLQGILTERFHLTVHREEKVMSHYALVAAKSGPRLTPSEQPGYSTRSGPGTLIATGLSLDNMADYLTRRLDRPVIDATGIPGRFDLKLNWSPDETQSNPEMPNPNQPPAAADETRPSIFRALEEQLGLKLEGRKGPLEILVVDRAERPTGN